MGLGYASVYSDPGKMRTGHPEENAPPARLDEILETLKVDLLR